MSRIRWAEVVEQARAIVLEYDGGVTLRQVHYRAVSAGLIPNTPSAYRHLSSHLARARREDDFPDLIDTLREVHVPPSWSDAGALVEQVPDLFRLDRTRDQQHALYVAAEKDSLRAMFTSWLADLGVPVLVVRGFGSQSYVQMVRERTARDPRPTVLRRVGTPPLHQSCSPANRPSHTRCRPRRGKRAIHGGRRSRTGTASTARTRFSGRSKRLSRTNCGAW